MQFHSGKSKESYRLLNSNGRQVLTFGTPLYRFKNNKDSRFVKLLEEDQVIQRTNDYIPAGHTNTTLAQEQIVLLSKQVPESYSLDPQLLREFMAQDATTRKQHEIYDPLRGNNLISIQLFDEPVYVFSAGSSLSTVVFAFATKTTCKIDDYDVQARFDSIKTIGLFDLKYPIQQIVESPLMNREEGGVIGVRTTSTITLFKLENAAHNKLKVTKLHHFHLAEKTSVHPDIDYSMPCDLALSPFSVLQYLFITNNGFVALVDISRNEMVFEGKDGMGDDLDYISRWRACSFTHIPSKYLLCSPECIKEWTVTQSEIHSKIISVPEDRIFGFTFKYPLLCYTTTKEVRIFDIRSLKEPIIDWIHDMRDGAPRQVFVSSQNEENEWVIGVYSTFVDRLSIVRLRYNAKLASDSKNTVEIQDYFRFELSRNRFEPIYHKVEMIHLVGLSTCLTIIPESNALFYSVYRLFENGEIKVQYILLEKNMNRHKPKLKTKPRYALRDDPFENLYRSVEVSKLPGNIDNSKESEITNVVYDPYRQYLQHIAEEAGEATGPFSSSQKMNVATKLADAKTPITYHELFGKEGYYNIEMDDLMSHLKEMVPIEKAEELPYLDSLIKGAVTDNESQFQEQSKNLRAAHEKEIKLSRIRLHRPVKDSSSFQYLPNDGIKYNSTITTRVLAQDWSIDNTPSSALDYVESKEDTVIGKETFKLASSVKRRNSVSFDTEIPSISFSMPLNDEAQSANLVNGESASLNVDEIPTIALTQGSMDDSQHLTPQIQSQVLPGRHGGRPSKKPALKKKKKSKSSGFR